MTHLDWYQSFLAVYRKGTVSKAAQERFLSQPAVTQHIAHLEKMIGAPLFQRTPRKMIPTDLGKELYARLVQPLETLEMITDEFISLQHNEQPILRLGTPYEFFSHFILEWIDQFPFQLRVQFGDTDELMRELINENLDLVLSTQMFATNGMIVEPIYREEFWLVASPKHPLPDPSMDIEEMEQWLMQQKWISYGTDLPIIRRFWLRSFSKRPPIRPYFVIPNLVAIAQALESSKGISLLPDYLCIQRKQEGKLKKIWDPPRAITNQLWLVAPKRKKRELTLFQEQLLANMEKTHHPDLLSKRT